MHDNTQPKSVFYKLFTLAINFNRYVIPPPPPYTSQGLFFFYINMNHETRLLMYPDRYFYHCEKSGYFDVKSNIKIWWPVGNIFLYLTLWLNCNYEIKISI